MPQRLDKLDKLDEIAISLQDGFGCMGNKHSRLVKEVAIVITRMKKYHMVKIYTQGQGHTIKLMSTIRDLKLIMTFLTGEHMRIQVMKT